MLIRYSRPRVRPPGNVALRVREGHPLADGLVLCFVSGGQFGLGRDLVTGSLFSGTNSPTIGLPPDGPALDVSSTAYVSAPKADVWNVTGPITVAVRGLVRSPNTAGQFVANIPSGGNGATNCPFSFEYANSSDGSLKFVRGTNVSGDNFKVYATAGSVISASSMVTAAVSQVDGYQNSPTFYANGVSTATTFNFGNGSGSPGTNSDPLFIGRRQDGAAQLDGQLNIVIVSRVTWDAGQHRLFHEDPYGLLEEAPLWYFRTVASSGYSLTLGNVGRTYGAGDITLTRTRPMELGSVVRSYGAGDLTMTYDGQGNVGGGKRTRRGARRIYLPEPEEVPIILPPSMGGPVVVLDDDEEEEWFLLS